MNSQIDTFPLNVAYKTYTCKNGTESSEEGHTILPEYVKNEWGVVCIPVGSGKSSAHKWALFLACDLWVENESHTHGKNGTIFFCLTLYAFVVTEFVLMEVLIVFLFEASY